MPERDSDRTRESQPDEERESHIGTLRVEAGDTSEYELAVSVNATLDGKGGPIGVRRRYEALPRQNDTVEGDAVDTNDELLADPGAVHVHTKFYGDVAAGEPDGEFLRDEHSRWEPTDPAVLTDGPSFRAACRAHFEATADATYALGVEAL